LNAEFDDAEAGTRGGRQCTPDGREDARHAEAPDRRAQRDVNGMCGDVEGPGTMWHVRSPPGCELPTSAATVTAPRAGRREGELQAARHVDWATIAFLLAYVKYVGAAGTTDEPGARPRLRPFRDGHRTKALRADARGRLSQAIMLCGPVRGGGD